MTFLLPHKNTVDTGLFLILLLLLSCTPKKPVDREGYQQEKAERELKRLTPVELMAEGEVFGKKILRATASTFQKELKRAIVEKGISGAVDYCHLNATDLVKKYEDSLGVSIMRVTDRPRNPADTLSGIDKEIWEAYEYSPNADAQLQELDEKTLILTKPITISTGLCLNCHGNPGSTITDENYKLIQSKYPQDKAIGYEVGDLRGMWRIIIPKKSVVRQL